MRVNATVVEGERVKGGKGKTRNEVLHHLDRVLNLANPQMPRVAELKGRHIKGD